MSGFRIRNVATRQIELGIPTPHLISEGGGEAYFVASDTSEKGVWYLHVPGSYESPSGLYTKVRIEHVEDYRVDVQVKPIGPGEADEEEQYDDYFIVQAAGEQEAMRLAEAAAQKDVESRFGDEYGSLVTTIRARRGVSI